MKHGLVVLAVLLIGCEAAPERKQVPGVPRPELQGGIDAGVEKRLADLLAYYRECHADPEVSLKETRSAARLAARMRAAGYDVTEGVGGTGVVGVLRNGAGPTVLIRGDTDALPLGEKTGLPYASRNEGVMHACGHDMHMAVLAGTGEVLAELKDHWRGTVLLVGQPAEEIGKGALDMIGDRLFERFPKPDNCVALHVAADLQHGAVGWRAGWFVANVDSVDIAIYGKGGHGSAPHTTVDPIVTAAHVIVALQTIVSRRRNPQEPGVITVGSIHGGSKHNIIPDEAKLQLTVRSYSDKTRKLLLDGIRQVTIDTCRAMGCPKDPDVTPKDDFTPAGQNDPGLATSAAKLFEAILGKENVKEVEPSMGGEDFPRFGKALGVPSFMYRLGTIDPARVQSGEALPSLHSPLYAPAPEPSIRTGVRTMAALAVSLLAKP